MVDQSVRLGRIFGIPVGINWSVVLVLWLLAWSLAQDVFPSVAPGYENWSYWSVAIGSALVFLGSLVLHELGHSLVARRAGVAVRSITLWLFGGVAQFENDTTSPKAEARVAAAGPAVSLALAVLFAVVAEAIFALSLSEVVAVGLVWLSFINGVLAVFNLIPAFPLDGGRVLRAILWHRYQDRIRATLTAAQVGTWFAYGLIGLGVVVFISGPALSGLWFVFLGWFLLTAARGEAFVVTEQAALANRTVREVMSPDPATVPASISVQGFIDEFILRHRHSSFPVVRSDGTVVGLVTLEAVRAVPPDRRAEITLDQIAVPLVQVPVVGPDDPADSLVSLIAAGPVSRALVFEHGDPAGRLVGIVSASDILRVMEGVLIKSS
ncbi:MAG: site-2 protease family protein [Acidimicrobiales bacterium]|nr:site-2 protease family protein [Acidimicrobiales bacterium]